MARARVKFCDPHYWTQVASHLFCALGGHDVYAGVWVRFRRGDVFRHASCEACLTQRGIERPHRPVTLNGDGPDVRARRAGGDE